MRVIVFCLVLSVMIALPDNPDAAPAYEERVIQINLGMKTRANQKWDGSASVSEGEVVAIPLQVYSQSEFGIYNQRESKTSWKMLTNLKNGGLFLKLRCSDDAIITIDNTAFPFSFTLNDLSDADPLSLNDGNIVITDKTGVYFYARTGRETGIIGEGTATIEPTVATVNTPGTWTLRFVVGEHGIPVGGGIRVALHQSRSWGEPQYIDTGAENLVTVLCSNTAAHLEYSPADTQGCFDWPYTKQIALIRVEETALDAGDIVTVTIGDRTGGSPGFRAARTNETYSVFRVEVCSLLYDDYFPIYRVIRDCPRVNIIPGSAVKAFLVAPSIVEPGTPFEMSVRVEDAVRNVASGYTGTFDLFLEGKPLDSSIDMSPEDAGIAHLRDIVLDTPGIYQFSVKDASGDIEGVSNPVRCAVDPIHGLYWGELHCHTSYSDGYGTMEELYTFLRDVAMLDFAAITDHDVEADSQDNTVLEMWLAAQHTTTLFNDPHQFVTFPAWEWSPHRYAVNGDHFYGDHNVFFAREDPARKLLDASTEPYNTSEKLYGGLDTLNESAMVIPHVGGSPAQWDQHSDTWQPVGEIYSVHGSFEGFGRLAVGRYKRKIGFIGASDTHNGQGGGFPPSGVEGHSMHGGLAAVYTSELSRDSLFAALHARRVYATSGPRILIDFTIDGALVGSEVTVSGRPELTVLAHGEAAIWKTDIIRNGKVIHSSVNTRTPFDDTLTILWRNWIPPDGYDRNYGTNPGIPRLNWDGELTIEDAVIDAFESRSFHLLKDEVTAHTATSISWRSQTRGDWDGLTVTLGETNAATTLHFRTGPATFTISPREMDNAVTSMIIDDTTEVAVLRGMPQNETVRLTFKDDDFSGDSYYYVRVIQVDGEEAWSSPIFVSGD
jgi:hypothetical protein